MSYLHCHSCGWSQDDWWSLRYNPLIRFWSDVKWLWKPRRFFLDAWIIHDIALAKGINIRVTDNEVHSWAWLYVEFRKRVRIFRRQTWWTYASWQRKRRNAVCPYCGDKNFDID